MPAQAGDAPKQPGGIQAPSGQHAHRPAFGHRRPQLPQHAQPFAAPGALGARGQDHPRHGDGTAPIDHADGQDHKALPQGGGSDGQRQLWALPPAHHPAQRDRKTGLDVQDLTLGAALARGVVIPFAQLLPYGLLLALHPLGQQVTHRGQGPRAGQHHPEAPQGQHGRLGLAQRRQMVHDRRQPLVETGLAKHDFPPYGCGSLHTPQYAVRREANHLLFKKPPPQRGARGGEGATVVWPRCFF